jgi:uncharacterized protein (TIGR02266 family)
MRPETTQPVPDTKSEKINPVDRRTTPRLPINAEVSFQSETNFFTGFSEDISTGGLFIATYDVEDIGEKLSLSFSLPGGCSIKTVGTVRWVREYNELAPETSPGMGIQFETLSPEECAAISTFVDQRSPLFYDA